MLIDRFKEYYNFFKEMNGYIKKVYDVNSSILILCIKIGGYLCNKY